MEINECRKRINAAIGKIKKYGIRTDAKNNPQSLPSLFLRMMIPCDLLIFQNFRNLDETTKMNALSIRDDDFLLEHTRVAYVICIIGNVLSRKQWHYNFARFFCNDTMLTCSSPNSYGRQTFVSLSQPQYGSLTQRKQLSYRRLHMARSICLIRLSVPTYRDLRA